MFSEVAIWSLSVFSLSALSRSSAVFCSNFSGSAGSTGAVGGRSSSEGCSATAVAVPAPSFIVPLGCWAASGLPPFVLGFFMGLGISQIQLYSIFKFCSRRDRHGLVHQPGSSLDDQGFDQFKLEWLPPGSVLQCRF